MTKTEQYCYDQGRGELKSVMNQLKECRELVKSYEKWTSDLKFPACPLCGMTPRSVEQRTKEDCKTRAKAALDDAFGGRRVYDCRDKAINVVIQAIDSVGVAL